MAEENWKADGATIDIKIASDNGLQRFIHSQLMYMYVFILFVLSNISASDP